MQTRTGGGYARPAELTKPILDFSAPATQNP